MRARPSKVRPMPTHADFLPLSANDPGRCEGYVTGKGNGDGAAPAHLLIQLFGASQSGKTYSALQLARGIVCDRQIKAILFGQHPHYDWRRLRHEASSSFKIMNAMLKMQRQNQGKEVAPHHFSNEAPLINWALTGKFDAVNRADLAKKRS